MPNADGGAKQMAITHCVYLNCNRHNISHIYTTDGAACIELSDWETHNSVQFTLTFSSSVVTKLILDRILYRV